MNLLQRFKQAPVTVTELKNNIFLPYEKEKKEPVENLVIFENKYLVGGIKITINGYKLNQLHRDILDIALYYGDNSLEKMTNDNRPIRLISLYEIQKHLKYKSKNNNTWLDKKIQELKRTTINIKIKEVGWAEFNIIDIAKYSKKQNKYAIVISDWYMMFFEKEISIGYKEYLPIILGLKNPQSKALARFLLSNTTDMQIDLDKAMYYIGIDENKMTKRNYNWNKNKILEDIEKLKELNIEFIKKSDDKRKKDYLIKYKKLPKIKIYFPNK
jgi:hypothetical protein